MGRIRVDLTGIISANESYYVKVDEGFVVDSVTSTPNTAITNTTDITFTTDPAPLLSTSYPADNDTSYDFARPGLVTISFPQAVSINTGNVKVYRYSDDTLMDTIAVTSGWIVGNDLKIETLSTLDPTVDYYVLYDAGIVVDGNGFKCPAETDKDNSETVSIFLSPSSNISKVSLLYPEDVTLATGNISVYKDSDDSLIQSFTVPDDVTLVGTDTVELVPTSRWVDDTVAYYVTADTGVVLDANGFESPAITKNVYGSVVPTWTYSGFTGVVRIDFDQNVFAGTGNITIKRASDNSVIETYDVTSDVTFDRTTVSMTATLYESQAYYINIDATAVVDGIGEAYAGISDTTTLNFTLFDGTLTSGYVPADGATDVTSTTLKISLSADTIKAGTGNIYLKKTSDDSTVDTFVVPDDITITGNSASFTTDQFADGIGYYVTVDSTALLDNGGVPFAGISSKTVWNFTTIDETFDLTNATYESKSYTITEDSQPTALAFKPDGTKLYVAGNNTNNFYQYSLSTAWDISTASYDSKSFSSSASPYGLAFKPDGTKMYAVDTGADTVYQYSLSTAWDISTASYDSISFAFTSETSNAYGLVIKDDGTKMYIIDTVTDVIYQYSMSTAWNVSTASYDSKSFDTTSQDATSWDFSIDDNGTKLFVMGRDNDSVYQYTLSTAWDISTASYDSVSYDFSTETGNPGSIYITSDGHKFYIQDFSAAKVYQYKMGYF